MSKHAAPEEPEDTQPEFPAWQVGVGIVLIAFFAILGVWRVVLEFMVR